MNMTQPNYQNLVDVVCNRIPQRIPLYEHLISDTIMERVLGKKFVHLYNGGCESKREYMKHYVEFFLQTGYDTVSFERCVTEILPGGGALSNRTKGCIHSAEEFAAYDWDAVTRIYKETFYEDFELLTEVMPQGMKAVGGVGNGVFETVQDLTGYEQLCYLRMDEPEVYEGMFSRVGNLLFRIWQDFLAHFADTYCVARIGDDLGFKSNLLLAAEDVRELIVPQYARIVALAKEYGKPFLWHSCGNIAAIMEDMITGAKIGAKHSNEDQIAPYSFWVETYGDRIGNCGGIDTDNLCRMDEANIRQLVRDVFATCKGHGGFAVGSGNSIPDYVEVQKYLAMVDEVKKQREIFTP